MSFHSLLNNETLNLISIRSILSPNDSDISDCSISRPSFLAIDYISTFNLLGCSFHACRITSIIWLCESKTSYLVHSDQIWQPPLSLLFIGAFIKDRNTNAILEEEEESKTHVSSSNLIHHSSTFNQIEFLNESLFK